MERKMEREWKKESKWKKARERLRWEGYNEVIKCESLIKRVSRQRGKKELRKGGRKEGRKEGRNVACKERR